MAVIKRMQVAHYCSCEICRGPNFTKTTKGTPPRFGTVLAHSDYPLGSKIKIEGYYDNYGLKLFTIEDRPVSGIKIPKDMIYIWVSDHRTVISRGVFIAKVTFL